MSGINKQKFLTELGRLLTFMYEEDRTRALAMYSSLFDETGDETGLLQLLGSPTRQAVNLARAYDARERKLQVMAQSRGEAAGDEPSFVRVIEQLRVQAAALGGQSEQAAPDPGTLFEDAANETALFEGVEAEPAPAVEPAPAPAEEPAPAAEEPAPAVEEPAPAVEEPAPAEEVPETPEAPEQSAPSADPVEAFLADFHIPEQPLTPAPAAEPPIERFDLPTDGAPAEEPASEPEAPPAEPRYDDLPPLDPQTPAAKPVQEEKPLDWTGDSILPGSRPVFTRSKPRVFLLILFLLFAVPVTLACIMVLLAPAAAALGAGVLAVTLGVTGITATFGSFTVFADILLVFGCTLIVLALALLFLWIFIWLIAGVIPGLIRGVCALARKWCYKEVPIA